MVRLLRVLKFTKHYVDDIHNGLVPIDPVEDPVAYEEVIDRVLTPEQAEEVIYGHLAKKPVFGNSIEAVRQKLGKRQFLPPSEFP